MEKNKGTPQPTENLSQTDIFSDQQALHSYLALKANQRYRRELYHLQHSNTKNYLHGLCKIGAEQRNDIYLFLVDCCSHTPEGSSLTHQARIYLEDLHLLNTLVESFIYDNKLTYLQDPEHLANLSFDSPLGVSGEQMERLREITHVMSTDTTINNALERYIKSADPSLPYANQRIDFRTINSEYTHTNHFSTGRFWLLMFGLVESVSLAHHRDLEGKLKHLHYKRTIFDAATPEQKLNPKDYPEYHLKEVSYEYGETISKQPEGIFTYTSKVDEKTRLFHTAQKKSYETIYNRETDVTLPIGEVLQQYTDRVIYRGMPISRPVMLCTTPTQKTKHLVYGLHIVDNIEGKDMTHLSLHTDGQGVYCFGYEKGAGQVKCQLYNKEGIFDGFYDQRGAAYKIDSVTRFDDATGLVTLIPKSSDQRPVQAHVSKLFHT